jgi:hypothetical protein
MPLTDEKLINKLLMGRKNMKKQFSREIELYENE